MLTLADLSRLAAENASDLHAPVAGFELGGRRFGGEAGPRLMGVINLSPDSWYRESVCLTAEAAIRRGRVLAAQGADMLDVGAESSLAHAVRVEEALQNSRLLPVVGALAAEGLVVSVETYRASVAKACLEAGAKVINLTGNAEADAVFRCAADHDAAVILCHVQGDNVRDVGDFSFGADTTDMLRESFKRSVGRATQAGVRKLWIDPGLGFYYRNLGDSALRIRHQMGVFLGTFRLRTLGWPVCHALPHAFECFEEEVRCAEPFFAVLAALGGTDLFRTHETARTKAVLDTMRLWRPAPPAARDATERT